MPFTDVGDRGKGGGVGREVEDGKEGEDGGGVEGDVKMEE